MRMVFIAVSIYLYTASLLSLMLGIHIRITKQGKPAYWVSYLLAAMSIYLFGYAMELNSTSLQGLVFWNYIQYLAIPVIPALWIIAAIQLSISMSRIRPYLLICIFLIPAITYIMRWTNPYFHLYYTSMELQEVFGQPVLKLEKGIWYFMQALYATLSFLAALVLYVKHYLHTSVDTDRRPAILLVCASSLPWAGLLINVINPGNISLDYTALIFPVSAIMLAGVLFRSDFLRIKPLARESLFNSTADGVIVLDTRLNIVDCNPAAKEMVPVPESLSPGISIGEAIPSYTENPQDMETALHPFSSSREEGTRHYESRMSPLLSPRGENLGYLVTLYDITERLQKIRSLEESEQRFRTLMQHIPYLAVKGINASGKVFYWNHASELLYGYRTDEAVGKPIADLIIPEGMREQVENELSRMIREEEHVKPKEMMFSRKDGSPIQVYTAFSVVQREGMPPELFCMDIDLTEIRRTQEALKRSQENLSKIIDLTPYMITITDREGTILLANKLFRETFSSAQASKLEGSSFYTLWNEPDKRDLFASLDQEVLTTGSGIYDTELSYADRNGSQQVRVTKVPFVSAEDNRICVLTIMVNITNERNLEEQLRHAEKIKALGQLSGGIAHEMNNMLQIILGYAEMVRELTPEDDSRWDMVESIISTGQRSADIVRQLLVFARKQQVSPQELRLNAETRSMLDILQRLVGENIQLVWDLSPEDPVIFLDPSQFTLVVTNLLTNARDAIEHSGTITITTSTVQGEEASHPPFPLPPGRYAVLTMCDTGKGIDPSILDRVFEPFFTTKPIGKGTGLGLSTVLGIMEQHNGHISIAHAQPSGTCVTLYFPLHAPSAAPLEETCSPSPVPEAGGETILVVEDEQELLQYVSAQLESLGYTVLSSHSPKEAVELASSHAGMIHLLLTDVIMPEMDGIELYTLLARNNRTLKVLYMSGYTGSLAEEISRSGNYLEKPFSRQLLAQQVRSVLDG